MKVPKLPAAAPIVHGPAMQALVEKQQRFVYEMMQDPYASHATWAKNAGYSDHMERCKVTACELLQNEKIERAVKEVARRHMHTIGPLLATVGLMKIAGNPKHRDHFKALEAVANRVGLHATTQHTVSVTHTDRTGEAMLQRIKELAAVMGVDADRLLGVNEAPKVIEHQPGPVPDEI